MIAIPKAQGVQAGKECLRWSSYSRVGETAPQTGRVASLRLHSQQLVVWEVVLGTYATRG